MTRPTILIVDDNRSTRTLIKAFLSKEYTIFEASDGAEAIQVLALRRPQVVLLDIMMPNLNGLQTLVLMKSISDFADTKVALISAMDKEGPETLAGNVEHQADAYFTKPFRVNDLKEWIQKQVSAEDETPPEIPC